MQKKTEIRRNEQRWLKEFSGDEGKRLLRQIGAYIVEPQQAEDLAQEVYLRLLRVRDEAIVDNPRAFALRVAANVAHEWRSLARNRMPHSSEPLETLDDGQTPDELFAQTQRIRRLEAALETLSPNCRAALLLYRRDNLTRAEVAKVMGISVGMVKKHLALGLAMCRRYQVDQDERKNENQD